MKVSDLMKRDVAFCAPTDSLNVAARIMWERDCGCVPVVNRDLKPLGIITDRDVCMAAYTQGLNLHTIEVRMVMASPVISCGPDDDVATAEALMRENKVRRLPVCDSDGTLVGIVSLNDFALEAEREAIEGTPRPLASAALAGVLAAVSEPRSHAVKPIPFGPEAGENDYPPKAPIKKGRAYR